MKTSNLLLLMMILVYNKIIILIITVAWETTFSKEFHSEYMTD